MTKESNKIQHISRLTPMQAGMLYHYLENKDTTAYVDQVIFTIRGEIRPEEFEKSMNIILQRHDILRTIFIYTDVKEWVQVALRERNLKIHFKDITPMTLREKDHYLETLQKKDRQKGFDLSKDILMRIFLIKTDPDSQQVCWTLHHIILDGWSLGILFHELIEIYQSITQGKKPVLSEASPYKNYLDWLKRQDKQKGIHYWKNYLKGFQCPVSLPKDRKALGKTNYAPGEYEYLADRELSQGIKGLAETNQVTIYTVCQALWGVLLHRYNDCADSVFGSVVSGRPAELEGIETMVGVFINTLPVRVRVKEQERLTELLHRLREDSVMSKKFDYVPLVDIQSHTSLKTQLIDHIMVFENHPVKDSPKEQRGFHIEKVKVREQTSYDFNIIIGYKENLFLKIIFNRLAYNKEKVEKIASHYLHLIKGAIHHPTEKVSHLTLLDAEEKKEILNFSRGEQQEIGLPHTVQELIERTSERVKDNIALNFNDHTLTYKELNLRAKQVSDLIRSKGSCAGREPIVGLHMERSMEMIIGILAIWKAGAACLPVDPKYPIKRKQYMLKDSQVSLVLTNLDDREIQDPQGTGRLEIVDPDIRTERTHQDELEKPTKEGKGTDLLYVIYTSGSTGKPKGVMLEHQNLVNLIYFDLKHTQLDCHRILQYHTICFDASFHEIGCALIQGGQLFLIGSGDQVNLFKLMQILEKKHITTLFLPMTFIKHLFLETHHIDQLPHCIRHIQTAGEQVKVTEEFRSYLKNRKVYLHNHYGPSETHVVTTLTLKPGNHIPKHPTIGKPIINTDLYIMDRNKQLVPIGIPGELYIAGNQVGRGYIGKEELTREKFLENPFPGGGKLYRTGDMGRWHRDGNIEFLGRKDHQVKIRGFRVEPGEIESNLLQHKEIKEAIVVSKPDTQGNHLIYAYYVSEKEISSAELREYLAGILPQYMIPQYLVPLKAIPLLPNGKADMQSLPEPQLKVSTGKKLPITPIEKKLADLWEEILEIDATSLLRDVNFFEIGGHSLKAAKLMLRLHKEFKVRISIEDVFKNSTIEKMAVFIKKAEKTIFKGIEKSEEKEYYPTSSSQKRLYVLHLLEPESTVYNMPFYVNLEGEPDYQRLERTFCILIERHSALRTSFQIVEEDPVQVIHRTPDFQIEKSRDFGIQIEDGFIRPFELSRAPLMRVEVAKTGEGHYQLRVDIHHIISDGISLNILQRDFNLLYFEKSLPLTRLEYKDYSEWLSRPEPKKIIHQQEQYWLKQFKGEIPQLNLPADIPRPFMKTSEGAVIGFELSKAKTRTLRDMAIQQGVTVNMLLLAAYSVWIFRMSHEEDLVIGTLVANRPHPDLEQIVGMFVNTLPIRLNPRGNKTFIQYMKEVKTLQLEAFDHQQYPFDELVEKLGVTRDTSRNPVFDTLFNYLAGCPGIVKINEIPTKGEYEKLTEPYKGFPVRGRGEPCVHPSFPDSHPGENRGGEKVSKQTQPPLYQHRKSTSKFDIALTAKENQETLYIELEYSVRLFKAQTIDRFIRYLKKIVSAMLTDPAQKLSQVELILTGEKNQLLVHFNQTEHPHPTDKTLPQLVEAQVKKAQHRGAISLLGEQITYDFLNSRANQLAGKLRNQNGIQPETAVAIMVEPVVKSIVAIIGILKAGAAYIPIDIQYPLKRVQYILEDSRARILISQGESKGFGSAEVKWLNLNDETLFQGDEQDLKGMSQPRDLAYIIYTSGTTGIPKGVTIQHQSVINLLYAMQRDYPITEQDTYLLKTPYIFDVSVVELFGWMLGRGRLAILEKGGEKDPYIIAKKITREKVTHINFVPSMFQMFIEVLKQQEKPDLRGLKYIFLAGESLTPVLVKGFRHMETSAQLENIYGPTENTIYSSKYSLSQWTEDKPISIGKPLDNIKLYILDKSNHLQVPGAVGELCVSGIGLSRGYLNNQELTAEKFVPHPFEKGQPLFKTGDLARRSLEGNLEFIGRIDHQVKIRGFRIELEEIESHLKNHKDIKEAVVLDKEDEEGEKNLYAYIVSDKEFSISDLREYLSGRMPQYMIPDYFERLESLFLMPNGKVDRKKFKTYGLNVITGSYSEPPGNDLEKIIAKAWGMVLNRQNFNISDIFFEVGGTSLKAIKLSLQLTRQLGQPISLAKIFQYPTIVSFARYIEDKNDSERQVQEERNWGQQLIDRKTRVTKRRKMSARAPKLRNGNPK
jgi:amino acid adenylation domain-containing protein